MDKKLDLSRPVQTRDGRPVRILCTDAKTKWRASGVVQPIVAIVTEPEGAERVHTFCTDGTWDPSRFDKGECGWDLVNAPERLVRYYNLYREGHKLVTGDILFDNKSDAEAAGAGSRGYREYVETRELIIEG